MKKILAIMFITTMLFGCGNAEGNLKSDIETTTERRAIVDTDLSQYFNTMDEFLSSEFCNGLREKDINIYTLSYDEERYEFRKVRGAAEYYEYRFHDNENNKEVKFTVGYDVRKTTMGYVRSIFDNDKNISTTAENSSGTYEVYLADSPLDSKDNYGLMYLPFEKYMVSIYANDSTSDEILEYFDDFELVAESTTSIEEIDWLSMSETEISDKIDSMTDDELEIVGNDITSDEMEHIKAALSEEQRDRLAPYYTSIDAAEPEISFATVDEFKASSDYQAIKSQAETLYLPEFDTERYNLNEIKLDSGRYEYKIYDNAAVQQVSISVIYSTYLRDIEEIQEMLPYEKNILTTAEAGGKTYDVYLTTSEYSDAENYSLTYLPYEGYHVTISSAGTSMSTVSSDEILEYFDDFELVAQS